MKTMKTIRLVLAALLLAGLSSIRPAWASSFSNDQSDQWWNAGENGWGIQFVQRGKTIFATMFVYDASGNPTWYVAAMEGTKPGGLLTFTGDLYATHGPWFGTVPYVAANAGGSKIGTMTWQKPNGVPGTLTYSVNGVNVTKSLTRQPIGTDNYTGTYVAGNHSVQSGCPNPTDNGVDNSTRTLNVVHNGTAFTMTTVEDGCTLVGTYAQNGQFGTVSGSFSCTDGKGTFDLSNMNVMPYAMTAVLSASSVNGCQIAGQIAGVRTD